VYFAKHRAKLGERRAKLEKRRAKLGERRAKLGEHLGEIVKKPPYFEINLNTAVSMKITTIKKPEIFLGSAK